MAEIFISYARTDRPRAERLAHALEQAGWSVWWDREIPPGRSFDEVIEEALTAARCVIVLWTDASVRSEWVKTEAAEAAQRRILVPILADGARIPLEFRRIQAAAIDDWRELESNEGWAQLCEAVAALVDSRRAPAARAAVPPRRSRIAWVAVTGAASLTLVAAGGAAYFATRAAHPVARPVRTAPAAAAAAAPASTAGPTYVAPQPAAPVEPSPPPPVPVRPRPQRSAPGAARDGGGEAPDYETAAAAQPAPSDRSIDAPIATASVAPKLDREPRADVRAPSFDVTLVSGVFRNHGRLSVLATGIRFDDGGGAGRDFELPCGSLRRVAIATMIADREQRLLELTASEHAYRLVAADTDARDGIRAAISRTCAR